MCLYLVAPTALSSIMLNADGHRCSDSLGLRIIHSNKFSSTTTSLHIKFTVFFFFFPFGLSLFVRRILTFFFLVFLLFAVAGDVLCCSSFAHQNHFFFLSFFRCYYFCLFTNVDICLMIEIVWALFLSFRLLLCIYPNLDGEL